MPFVITDKKLNPVTNHLDDIDITKAQYEESMTKGSLLLSKNIRLSNQNISGGHIFYIEDLSSIIEMVHELSSKNELLSEEKELIFDDETTRKVHIVADKSYDLAGINEIPTSALSIDDDNYALNAQDIENVTLKNYDTADFYCGIHDIFTFSGREDIMITTKIARGTLNKGDSLYIHENGKFITVTGIEKGRVKVEKATIGEEVSLLVTGVKKEEVGRGYTISKKDTLKEYDLLYGKLYVFTKDEGGRHTPLMDSKNERYFPNIRFKDTNSEKTARMFYPSGTNMVAGGETVENVKFYLPTSTPAFVGRTFTLIESGKTIAKVEVTGVHKHDANYSRNGTCYECNYSSGYSLKWLFTSIWNEFI
uniref:Uncharacterized protein n=1 Tax=Junco hyemalis TaxID=40217 RepID=A0A8C5ICT7_JUNHY